MTSAQLRVPRTAYLAAGALAVCVTPMVQAPWLAVVYVLPIAAILYVARSGTAVDDQGITARAMVGSVRIPWADVVGLRVSDRGQVYALLPGDRQVRLPGARPKDVAVITAISSAAGSGPASAPDPQPAAEQAKA
ncbi:MAG: hypothetical protein JWN61_2760 [Pseudonocardiales bacterium]|nr:hypothetical protein [Pseudonocardiales bacterium]